MSYRIVFNGRLIEMFLKGKPKTDVYVQTFRHKKFITQENLRNIKTQEQI